MDNNNDTTDNGTRNFITDGLPTYLQPLQDAFDGHHWWVEVDQISIQRNVTGDFKGTAKGYKRNLFGMFEPTVIYVENETVSGAIADLIAETLDSSSRWFKDRYPKSRNARAVAKGTGDYEEGHPPV